MHDDRNEHIDGPGIGERAVPGPTGRPQRWPRACRRTALTIGLAGLVGASATAFGGLAPASTAATRPAATGTISADGVSVFARVPAPGHPFGIAVDSDRVYVTTSDGDFFAPHLNSNGERVFAYDLNGRLERTTKIATLSRATMGLNGIALDGNQGKDHAAFVADMNGRILRVGVGVGGRRSQPTVFAEAPEPFTYGNWGATMWNDLVFDPAGRLYMTDDKPRIWRVATDGTPQVWFQDSRLMGLFGFAGGPLGGRIDPTGRYLYFAVTVSNVFPTDSLVYRLPLVDQPGPGDLELVHRFPAAPGDIPGQTTPNATGIAFAASGNLYVALSGAQQVAVLDPAGNELRRISSPLFDSPWGLAFLGDSLLVSNASIRPEESPDRWNVLTVNVSEPGLPLNRPTVPVPAAGHEHHDRS